MILLGAQALQAWTGWRIAQTHQQQTAELTAQAYAAALAGTNGSPDSLRARLPAPPAGLVVTVHPRAGQPLTLPAEPASAAHTLTRQPYRAADGTQQGEIAVGGLPVGLPAPLWLSAAGLLLLCLAAAAWMLRNLRTAMGRWQTGPLVRLADHARGGEPGERPDAASDRALLSPVYAAIDDGLERQRRLLAERDERIAVLESEARHDPVTRLMNRRVFFDAFRNALRAPGQGEPAGHLLIFRQRDMAEINRHMHHEATDQWLRLTATHLSQTLTSQGGVGTLLARINGSDFAALLPASSTRVAHELAEHMRRELRLRRLPLKNGQWCRWALALTAYRSHEQVGTVLARLDHALMRAEISNSDDLQYADDRNEARVDGEYSWQDILVRALEEHRFFLRREARRDAAGTVLHHKATLWLRDPGTPEPIHASQFMPPASRLGLAADCDIQAVRLALDQQVGAPGDLAVQLAPASLEQPSFRQRLRRLLEDRPALARRLVLEIDAHGLVDYFEGVQALCDIATAAGARVSVRRLSEQFAALERLHQLPLAYLKVGGGFVHSLAGSPGNRHLAATVAQTARTLGVPAYAQHAPDQAIRELLSSLGFIVLEAEPDTLDAGALDMTDPHESETVAGNTGALAEPTATQPGPAATAADPAVSPAWPAPASGVLRKRQEQADQRLSELAGALQAQRQMHSLLSHELRTPAATISAAAQSLETILAGSGQDVDTRLARIRRNVTRMIDMLDQVLSPQRQHDQALTPRPESCDLGDLVRDTAASIQPDTAHLLVVNTEAQVPVLCDPLLTGLVLRNLIQNAIKYSPADKPILIDAGLSSGAHGALAWLAVTDQGPGIEEAEAERIFEPHFRRAAHRETPGTGLGLHLARQLCINQGGSLTVQTQPGQGARFVIALPTPQGRGS
ncbi:EAL domain-containing protein [Pseudomonadota bacterium AL_CKDN230030165-1A_HGKHYDSX7]